MNEEETGFVIKDRRRFTSEGETRKSEEAKDNLKEGKAEKPPDHAKVTSKEEKSGEEPQQRPHASPLPEVTFATFILSLVSSSLVHLGEVPDPTTGQTIKELAIAKHTIDTIAMLKEKTKGNLSEDEQKMMDHVLYDLRMRYVATQQ